MKVVTDKPVVKTGIYKYSNFEDGSDTHPGRTLYEDLRKQDKHGDVGHFTVLQSYPPLQQSLFQQSMMIDLLLFISSDYDYSFFIWQSIIL